MKTHAVHTPRAAFADVPSRAAANGLNRGAELTRFDSARAPTQRVSFPLFAGHGEPWPLAPWDNDGIVNAASMLWPDGLDTRLVHADHGDIIGHFALLPAKDGTERQYHTYDLLGSASQFDQPAFEKVWTDVFAFCVER